MANVGGFQVRASTDHCCTMTWHAVAAPGIWLLMSSSSIAWGGESGFDSDGSNRGSFLYPLQWAVVQQEEPRKGT
ncbi:hypothetical protein P170DRAFT_438172 [Aspergillus steynii IBT 23096]|uniref:Uncharacterized protein n=1 Tax=Aspergillus steynii IBT 23096 TaxID=1392250 RepID=A0A2I2G0E3_9EURO|nr:uncharacterized protein P170DRAFT_438172 [Aspergillus steynii IBT 23096]PLB46352.1 hypothetical protein P170DRAFT_438172 [Aspergillus steynii IBT 23096]